MAAKPKRANRLPRHTQEVRTYPALDGQAGAFSGGRYPFLVVVGTPGLQKSKVMADAAPAALRVENHVTAFGLYCQCFKHLDQPVILDDIELWGKPELVSLLKCLCNTDPVKTLRWTSATTMLDEADVPAEFQTRSPVCIIANEWRTLTPAVAALEDRAQVIHFAPSAAEVHRRVGAFFRDDEIYEFVGRHLQHIRTPSMRDYGRAAQQKAAAADLVAVGEPAIDWRANLLNTWLPPEAALVVALHDDPSFPTEEARAVAFTARTGISRATYFRRKKELNLGPAPAGPGTPRTAASPQFQSLTLPAVPADTPRILIATTEAAHDDRAPAE